MKTTTYKEWKNAIEEIWDFQNETHLVYKKQTLKKIQLLQIYKDKLTQQIEISRAKINFFTAVALFLSLLYGCLLFI
ncbi:MAG: hypothetical protein NVS9B7_10580 [Flavisolibacter sp.]